MMCTMKTIVSKIPKSLIENLFDFQLNKLALEINTSFFRYLKYDWLHILLFITLSFLIGIIYWQIRKNCS